jgi:DNA-binding HxlR family transcriptional regulator
MRERKSYGQFCALARTLDRIGDRWTLLIIRELLLGCARYGDLHRALPGLATNLLALRLQHLEADGLIQRAVDPAHRLRRTYELTDHGRALEPVLLEMIRWGAGYMSCGPGADVVDDRWALLAMRALLDTTEVNTPRGDVLVRCGDQELTVTIGPQGRQVLHGPSTAKPRAAVIGSLPDVLALVAYGHRSKDISVQGDGPFLWQALSTSTKPTNAMPKQ